MARGLTPEEMQNLMGGATQAPSVVTPASPAGSAPGLPPQEGQGTQGEQKPGFLGTIGDMGKGAVGGALDAVDETLQFGHSVANWFDNSVFHTDAIEDEWTRKLPDIESKTVAGNITREVSKFLTGFVGAGKVLKGAKVLQGAGKGIEIARGAVQGAMTDLLV